VLRTVELPGYVALSVGFSKRGVSSLKREREGGRAVSRERGFSPLSRVEETYVVRDRISYLGHCTASIISHREV
jgi:hypothetical protein